MRNCVFHYLSVLLFSIQLLEHVCSSRKVYLDENCGSTFDLSQEQEGALKLSLTANDVYAPYTDCHVTIVANQDRRIGVTFLRMDIMSFATCQSDYLQIYDGMQINNSTFLYTTTKHEQHCGRSIPPHYASAHSNITVRFVSDSIFSSKGFTLLLTAFHTGLCQDHEFKCSNARCIHEDLYCDQHDNCGDSSDLCHYSLYIIAGVTVSSVILIIAIIFLCSVLHYRFRKRAESDNFDSVSIGTEYTEFEQGVPVASEDNINNAMRISTRFPGVDTNVLSVITRSSIDNHHHHPRIHRLPSREPPAYSSASRSFWLNNQLVF